MNVKEAARNDDTLNDTKFKKRYNGGTIALDGINLEVKTAEFIAVIGPSGAGNRPCCAVLTGSSNHRKEAFPFKEAH